MKVHELAQHLDEYLQINQFSEAAYNGIQVANSGDIAHVATAVTASLQTVEQAAQLGVQALIVHHGIFRKQDEHPIVACFIKKSSSLWSTTLRFWVIICH